MTKLWRRALLVALAAAAAGLLAAGWAARLALERAAVAETARRAQAVAAAANTPRLAEEAAGGDEASLLIALLGARDAGAASALVARPDLRIAADTDPALKGRRLSSAAARRALRRRAAAWEVLPGGEALEYAVPVLRENAESVLLGRAMTPVAVLVLRLPLTAERARALRLFRRAAAAFGLSALAALVIGVLGLYFLLRANERIRALESELERDAMQREFVANVSHEFRTPIAAIKGFAETLLGGALEDAENRREFVDIILHHAGRLSNLVEDLLQLSVLESREYKDAREALELKPFCETVARSVEPLAAKAGLSMRVEAEPGLRAVVDKSHFEALLLNLLKNAVEYNRPGGRVALSARADGGAAHLTVEDTGIGIAPADRERLFRRFHRARAAKEKKPEGTGLGLLIVKRIVERHGGEVWVESEPGRGAAFHVKLPRP